MGTNTGIGIDRQYVDSLGPLEDQELSVLALPRVHLLPRAIQAWSDDPEAEISGTNDSRHVKQKIENL
jgi:hypothetical protein